MVQIPKRDFEALKEAGLIKFAKSEKNFQVTSRQKSKGAKKYYVVESKKIMLFLENQAKGV